jgi:hypothetical protein
MVRQVRTALVAVSLFLGWLAAAAAMPARSEVEAFLDVTGFDVALQSIRYSARDAPKMLGMEDDAFGTQWQAATADVFDADRMHDMAVDILRRKLEPELLAHARAFYASDLGQRIVRAENAAHATPDDTHRKEQGEAIVAALVREGAPRLETLRRMVNASDPAGLVVPALREVQVRFLLAAERADVIRLRVEPDDLRRLLSAREGKLRREVQRSALSGAAYTYRSFSDAEIATYANALEHPDMQTVYALMTAVQFAVMTNRFEALARRLADLQRSAEL